MRALIQARSLGQVRAHEGRLLALLELGAFADPPPSPRLARPLLTAADMRPLHAPRLHSLLLLALVGCDVDEALLEDTDADRDAAGMPADTGPEAHEASLPAPRAVDPADSPAPALADHRPAPVPFCPNHPTPSIERAWKLDQKGFLDTTLAMSSFFNGPHTVMGWVMPEFTANHVGPIFAENGGGVYVVGQGDYLQGTGGATGPGGVQLGTDPVLQVSIGGLWRYYLAPGYKKREWNHIALVRTAPDANGDYKFQLYVNGTLLTPMWIVGPDNAQQVQSASEITFGPTNPMPSHMVPNGQLRFGRRTSGLSGESSESWQFYGLIDEVAVFDHALTANEILYYKTCGLSGNDPAMVAGWTFDLYSTLDPAGPKILEPIAPFGPMNNYARRVTVASGFKPSNHAADAPLFDSPTYLAPTQTVYELPFPFGEEWFVTQGIDEPTGTHNGYAAFSWDFYRIKPAPAAGAIVQAAAPGEITEVFDDRIPNPGEQEGNLIRIRTAPRENLTYLHQEPGSFSEVFLAGSPLLPPLPQDGPAHWIAVVQDALLAKVGTNAQHLHIAAHDEFLTFPIAFSSYEVKDPAAPSGWTQVTRGQPKYGQIIRRM
jgi:hypothetical protein